MTVLYDLVENVEPGWVVPVPCFMRIYLPSRTISTDLLQVCGTLEMLMFEVL